MEKVALFDFISNVNEGNRGKNLMADVKADPSANLPTCVSKGYVNFMVNRAMSQHEDCIFIAQELNLHGDLPKKMHYDFARNLVRGRKRYGKWAKAPKDEAIIELIKKHYNYNTQRAQEASELLTNEQKKELKKIYHEGGRV